MSNLPKPAVPTSGLELSNGKTVRVRAYSGAEEKILLSAKFSGSQDEKLDAAISVIEGCIDLPLSEVPGVDLEKLFLRLYEMSVSDKLTFSVGCEKTEGCDGRLDVSLPVSAVTVPEFDMKPHRIDVGKGESGEDIYIFLQPYSLEDLRDVGSDSELKLFYSAVKDVYLGDSPVGEFSFEEFEQWIMTLRGAYLQCLNYVRQMPKAELKRDWVCPKCSEKHVLHLKGFSSFFRYSPRTMT